MTTEIMNEHINNSTLTLELMRQFADQVSLSELVSFIVSNKNNDVVNAYCESLRTDLNEAEDNKKYAEEDIDSGNSESRSEAYEDLRYAKSIIDKIRPIINKIDEELEQLSHKLTK